MVLSRFAGGVRTVVGDTRRFLSGAAVPGDLDERDTDYIRDSLPGLWLASELYFRADVRGLEHLPEQGPVLCIGNHSGGMMIPDTFVFTLAFCAFFGPERRLHPLAHDRVMAMPGVGRVLRKFGVLPASWDSAKAALDTGAAVLVYPGGDYDTFRPSWQSSRIDFGGRSGFLRVAMEHDVPIAPVVSIGGQETALFLSRGERLAELTGAAKAMRVKTLPVSLALPGVLTPLFGHLPLPAKITVQVLKPLRISEQFGPDADIDEVYSWLTARMQSTLDGLAGERRFPVVG